MYKGAGPWPPARTYEELKSDVMTLYVILHTISGPLGDYHTQLWWVQETLNSNTVWQNKHVFTLLHCRQIMWAIIDDGRNFFSKRYHPKNFVGLSAPPMCFSLLWDLICDIQQGKLVLQGNPH